MKLLAINRWSGLDPKTHSPIDFWRVHTPLEELKKHVDWQIDYLPTFLPGADEFTSPDQFTEDALERAAAQLGEYDIIYSSYQPSPYVYALLHIVRKRYGTKYVLDNDDDPYTIDKDSFYWQSASEEDARNMQRMVELGEYLTTPTRQLRAQFEHFSKGRVFQVPNYISDAYQNTKPKDGEQVTIGYFGGASHYHDLHETGILPALQKLMHTHKQVHLTTVGIPVDTYLPKARYHELESGDMHTWLDAIYPSLNFDIVVAPLRQTAFGEGKSNIKWQEATRMSAAFVASRVGPYRDLKPDTVALADNTEESWYAALERLLDSQKRAKQVLDARYDLHTNWRIEDHWQDWRDMFISVKGL